MQERHAPSAFHILSIGVGRETTSEQFEADRILIHEFVHTHGAINTSQTQKTEGISYEMQRWYIPVCAVLLLASPSMCDALSTEVARAEHRKPAKISRTQAAKP